MDSFFSLLYIPFGFLFRILFDFIGNYGIALFIFALFFRLILVPTSIKQQKGSAKSTRMQPKLRRIREKYAHVEPAAERQQKIQAETTELYQKEGYSSMTAGCAPLLVQLPILWGLYGIIRQPLTYVLNLPKEAVSAISDATMKFLGDSSASAAAYIETNIINNIDKVIATNSDLAVKFPEAIEKIQNFEYTIFGIDLGAIPSFDTFKNFSTATTEAKLLLLIPILSFAASMATSLLTQMRQKKANPNMENAQMMGCMMYSMPLMSLYFGFQFPAGMGMYWILSSAFAFFQTLILGKLYAPRKIMARDMIEETIYRRSYEATKKK